MSIFGRSSNHKEASDIGMSNISFFISMFFCGFIIMSTTYFLSCNNPITMIDCQHLSVSGSILGFVLMIIALLGIRESGISRIRPGERKSPI